MGHVNQRGRNRWEVRVEVGRDPLTGRRQRIIRQVKGSKKDAEAELARLVRQVETGMYAEPSKLTVGAYLDQWLAYMAGQLAPSAHGRYRRIVELHLVPAFGNVPIQKLRPAHIAEAEARWLASGRYRRNGTLSGTGLSPKTVLNHHRVLHKALSDAVKVFKVLQANPCESVKPPRWERQPVARLTAEEALQLVDALEDDDYGAALYTLLYTGLRVGEVLGLRWREDVDLGRRQIAVQQQWDAFAKVFRETKTRRATRPVSLDRELVAVLERQRTRQKEWRLAAGPVWSDSGLVFTGLDGSPLTPSMLRRALNRVLDRAGLKHIHRHGLRHTHATLMVSAGVHMRVISERMGHATYAFTADNYAHLDAGIQDQAAETFAESLRRKRNG